MAENFDFEELESENLSVIKDMLSSEIELIRNTLDVAAIFLGEAAYAFVEYLNTMSNSHGDSN